MMLAQEEEEFVTTTSMVKGKRSKWPRPLALATNSDSSTSLNISSTSNYSVVDFTHEGEEEAEDGHDIEYMANCLILLAKGENYDDKKRTETNYYQCKTCNKSFSSFQALGGHRASHSKPTKASQEDNMIIKTSSAAYDDQEKYHQHRDDNRLVLTLRMPISGVSEKNPNNCNIDKKSSKVHECLICGAGFSSGQALGGHMRRHRVVDGGGCRETKKPRINLLGLNLNLPAPEGDDHDHAFMPKEQVVVFSASSLIDCHY